jgi:hypothetical protein
MPAYRAALAALVALAAGRAGGNDEPLQGP